KNAQLASAEVIKKLALAADRVHLATVEATKIIQAASQEAALTMKKAIAKANRVINSAIEEANEAILQAVSQALASTVGEEEAEFFDLAPLKEKWGKRKT
ncbi:MAG: hypothetical protein HN403_20220, partial [Rhodospirillales bacterium]|nr:hypothetical protein [Rhodospirillales bacterium]